MSDTTSRLWTKNESLKVKLVELKDGNYAFANVSFNKNIILKEQLLSGGIIEANSSLIFMLPTEFDTVEVLNEIRATLRTVEARDLKLEIRFYSNNQYAITDWIELHSNSTLVWGSYPMLASRAELRVTNLSATQATISAFQVIGIK